MKKTIGVLLILAGIALGLYVGLYLCFICGIIDIIKEIRSSDLNAVNVAWDIVRIMFASVAGWICAFLFITPGYAMVK